MVGILCTVANVYFFALLGRIILSWFPIAPGGALAGVFSFLYAITEPVLGPLRRAIPAVRLGGMALDLSPIIVIVLLQVVFAVVFQCRIGL